MIVIWEEMYRYIILHLYTQYTYCALCNLSANVSIPRNDDNIIISYHHNIIIFITMTRVARLLTPTYIVIQISDANGRVRIVHKY